MKIDEIIVQIIKYFFRVVFFIIALPLTLVAIIIVTIMLVIPNFIGWVYDRQNELTVKDIFDGIPEFIGEIWKPILGIKEK